MHTRKSVTSIGLIAIFIIVILLAPSGQARSLYVNVLNPGTVRAYKIVGDHIQYQTDAQNLVYYGSSPVGITLDPDSGIAFITYEYLNVIELLNAKTMVSEGAQTVVGQASNLAGIAFDQSKQKLYVVDRPTNHLFVYFWNARTKTLSLEGGTYKVLPEVNTPSYGVAFDSLNNSLYVTDATNSVKRYGTSTWQYEGSVPIVVGSTPRQAVGIAIDSQRRYMYTGSFTGTSGSHTYLVRTDISDPNNPSFSQKDIGAYVIGLAIDEETGYLYVTAENNTLRVYNMLTWPSDPCYVESSGILDPAGMCLGGDVEYKPPLFYLEKVDVNEPNCVSFDDYITYRITYGPNSFNHNDVVITDYLPDELVFISASGPNSVYNPSAHTVTWQIGPLDVNTPNDFVTLTMKVNGCAESDGNIINYCVIESDIAYRDAECVTYLCCASNPNPTCGEIVDWDVVEFNLTWCPGHFAADVNGHEVYFGTNFNDVNNSDPNVYKGTVTNPSYPIPLGSLDKGTTYYWRIDEVNTAHPDLRWRGGVWSFTTGIYKVVDNFESYVDVFALRNVWDKGTTRAIVTLITDLNYVHGGNQSMQFRYSNGSTPYYSEAYADTPDLPSQIGSDWSDGGLLRLYFYGYAANDPNEPMYVKLTDGSANTAKVLYDGDPTDLKEESWHEWNIPLPEFTDVNLADVKKIAIGFGDGVSSPSQSSYIYFDDIRLYLAGRCIPGYYPAGDFDSDCVVDFYDFAIFALAWLTNDPNISLDDDNDVDIDDLALFCDDWLWQEGGETMLMASSGFSELLYAPPPQQPQIELQPEPEPQLQVQSEPELLQPEPQPQPQYEPHHTTQELIDLFEERWLTDEQLRSACTEAHWLELIETIRQTPVE